MPLVFSDQQVLTMIQRRIYPSLLLIIVAVGLVVMQLKQFRKLYEHIKNDRWESSVTGKKSPKLYKSCPKWFHYKNVRFWQLYKKCGQFGQNSCCHRLRKVAQSALNRPIWSHWVRRDQRIQSCKALNLAKRVSVKFQSTFQKIPEWPRGHLT